MACGAPLRASAGFGPRCRARVARAAAQAVGRAAELIEDGGIVPAARPGVFVAVSSDGTRFYVADAVSGTCTCTAGQYGRRCYHLAAAEALTVAGVGVKAA